MATTKKKKSALDDVNSGIIFPTIFSKEMNDRLIAAKSDDIAPLAQPKRKETTSFYEDYAPIRTVGKLSKNDDIAPDRTWFNKGLFKDGYNAGDIAKTILGTATDLDQNVKVGILRMGEQMVDAGATGIGALGGALGNDKLKDKAREFAARDLYDEEKLAKNPMIQSNPFASISHILGLNTDEISVLGEKSDSLAQSGGQLAGTVALQGVGVPWWLTTGATSFGAETETAFREGADYKEAALRGGISAAADILTEKLTGGIKFGGKALDEVLVKRLTQGISNKVAKNLVRTGMGATGEGFEEVMASVANNLGEKLYNEDTKVKDLLLNEQAMDEYLESFIGGFALGGGASASTAVNAITTGRDSITGLTDNEQRVVDTEVQRRISEQETDGKKLSKKERAAIEKEVRSELEKGGISIDTIESALGGETLKKYKSTVNQENSLRNEIAVLENMKDNEITVKQRERLAKAREELENLGTGALKEQLSKEVDELTQSDTFLRESYSEKSRKGQAYEADLTKYKNKAQQAIIQKAIDSKILNNTRRTHEFVDMISKIAADKGVSFDFTNNEKLKESGFAIDGATVNGYVQGNNISLNIQSAKALEKVVGHEITHVLEGTELYSELQTAVKQYAETKGEYATRLKALEKLYEGVEDANIENELTADLIGDYLFTDEKFVNSLSTKNPNIFKKIYDEIKYLVKVATAGTKEAKELEKVKRIFDKVYKQSTTENSGTMRLSLEITEDGTKYVDVNMKQDMFIGLNESESRHKAREVILDKFAGKIIGEKETQPIVATKRTAKEYAWAKKRSAQGEIAIDKMRASTELDNLLEASEHVGHATYEEIKGKHPEAVGGMDYYKTIFKVSDRWYEGIVNVINSKNVRVFYDVTKLKSIAGKNGLPVNNNSPAPQTNASENIIPESQENTTKNSLSKKNQDIALTGKYFGKDMAFDTPITDAPIRSDVKQQTGWEEDDEVFGTYSGETEESPFEGRDIKDVGKRNVNAYQYDNPEVKPYFKLEAEIMLWDLQHSSRGERIQTGTYDTGQDWTGVKRATSDEIADLLDNYNYSYDDIEKGLNAIIQDHGAENIAVAKRIEFILDERLRNGYTDFTTGKRIEPNQEYIDLMSQKNVPVDEDIAPTKQEAPVDDDIAPVRAPKTDAEIAKVLDVEPKTKSQRNRRKLAIYSALLLDKGLPFENLSLKTKNRELMGKWNYTLYSGARAQRLIGKGDEEAGVKSLDSIREEVGNTGKTREFYEYMYHKHNVDRMSLADRYDNMENKSVFGDSITSEYSQKVVEAYENKNPEFIEFANEVYTYNRHLRQQLVDNGVISKETADLWEEMYPHYIPVRRVGDKGLNINVPLDTRRTGINAPVKRATGGNSDILPLFDTMAMRTMQTYTAIAKNSFGVELKNTLNSVVDKGETSLDEVFENIESEESLLQEGKNGLPPRFTVFENGEKITFDIDEDMYDALKPTSEALARVIKPTSVFGNVRRGLLTEYNPTFLLTNGIKDIQDVLINSQHPLKTYKRIPEAYAQIAKKGYWYNEYMKAGGEQNSYFDNDTLTFDTKNKGIKKLLDTPPLSTISKINTFIETAPRLAEYIASREAGASTEVAMLDAARVTTNFKAGGDFTKFLNRNGATFLNASVQGAMQQVRNFREAQANGAKGWVVLAAKFAVAGVPAMILNSLIWDDDEEYEELSDYVKQNYYVVWKTDDGQFVRIPKGRAVAVIQDAMEQVVNLSKGNDEADLRSFVDLVLTNIAPANPLENNIFAPITQVAQNETWYGEDLVPTRLQDLPKAEQFDETTDEFSKWLGQKLNVSPVKINYLLDQYSGGVGDMVLPMMTPQAENKTDSKIGTLLAPLRNKFVTDGVINNQNVADFYDMSEELTTNAKMSTATDEDVLMNKYMNSISGEMSQLYAEKREVQNSNLKNSDKYERVREIQNQIVELSKEGLNNFSKVEINGNYATVGSLQYLKNEDGEWKKLTADQVAKQDEVTSALGIKPADYWGNKDEYNEAYENPAKYAVMKSVGGYDTYKSLASDLYGIKADKDLSGKSISGTRKKKVAAYINNLDVEDEVKYILFKSEYPSDDSHNYEIVEYLNSRDDISYSEMETILKELDFKVDSKGNISW